jgi:hypothetical protein
MTMVPLFRSLALGRMRVAATVWMATVLMAIVSFAEEPPVHYWHADAMPPGAIGSAQLLRGGPLPGYFQPIEILAPRGALISMADADGFQQPVTGPQTVGMLIGSVYRLKVINIAGHEGLEVYPSLEVIDRLYPPVGQARRFAIPVEITQEEIELALSGRFVTRVIYLEDPENVLPVAEQPDEQSVFEASPGDNPLNVADRLGRPMAILRLGGRLPDADGPDATFLYGSPPWLKFCGAPIARPTVLPPSRGAQANQKQQTGVVPRPLLQTSATQKSIGRRGVPVVTATAR